MRYAPIFIANIRKLNKISIVSPYCYFTFYKITTITNIAYFSTMYCNIKYHNPKINDASVAPTINI